MCCKNTSNVVTKYIEIKFRIIKNNIMVKINQISLNDEEKGRIERFKIIFNDANISQTKFASLLGTKQQIISAILKGERKCGKSYTSKLYTAFGVNPEWFDTGEGEKYIQHQNSDFCIMCAQKDQTIEALQETIDSLKETIRLLKEKYEEVDTKKVG